MKKFRKLSFLFCAYLVLMILDGCSSKDDDFYCGNSNYIPYFDFQTLEGKVDNQEILSNQNLEFEITLADIEFLALQKPPSRFGLINSAFACSPLPNGADGLKFPLEKIEIFSDQDFDDTFKAGVPLNGLVKMNTAWYSTNPNFVPLQDVTSNDLQFYEEYHNRSFMIDFRPTQPDIEHKLKVVYYKSNGEQVEVTLDPVVWK